MAMLKSTLRFVSLVMSLAAHSTISNTLFHADDNHFAVTGKDTLYEFTARLVEATPIEAACSDAFGFAVIQKFEVLHTTYPKYKKKFVLIIQPCPEEGGEGYFVANRIYKMSVASSPPQGTFLIQNLYSAEHLPNFGRERLKG
jgi:hypothetical protein